MKSFYEFINEAAPKTTNGAKLYKKQLKELGEIIKSAGFKKSKKQKDDYIDYTSYVFKKGSDEIEIRGRELPHDNPPFVYYINISKKVGSTYKFRNVFNLHDIPKMNRSKIAYTDDKKHNDTVDKTLIELYDYQKEDLIDDMEMMDV